MAKRQAFPYSIPASRRRRRGQALLLAVLVMIFAALLGAAFIAVVSVNLNETARQSDKTAADQSARAGLKYVNDQLTYSADGRNWFDKNYDTAFFTSVASDPTYYSSVARAQGWAGKFAVFPDPRQPNFSGPRFMARVEKIPYNSTASATTPDSDKPGTLRITVIGLSPDDGTAWSKSVAYKGGIDQAPVGQVMHTVSNWDFESAKVPSGKIAVYTSPSITIQNPQGRFPTEGPFYITIGPGTTNAVRGALVQSAVVSGTTATLTLANPAAVTPPPAPEDLVQLAAGVGIPTDVDYDRDTATTAVSIPGNRIADNGITAGFRGNGGLYWFGQTTADLLQAEDTAYGASLVVPGTVKTSGVIALKTGASVTFQGNTMGSSATLLDSAQTNFPANVVGAAAVVEDGYNRIKGNISSPGRDVLPFTPPNFSNGRGLDRYRELTKFSDPIAATDVTPNITTTISDSSSPYGYGKGIYIDNIEDRERTYDGTTRRDMTRSELYNLWFDQESTTGAFYLRKVDAKNPDDTADTNRSLYSLEDTHRRGWVARDEFVPRGAMVELVQSGGNYYLDVTRDAAQDNNSAHPTNSIDDATTPKDATDKHWKEADGTDELGIYYKRFNWPANGILFAEGNIRIRGAVTDPPSSLTVVSMNNIYIEGTTRIDSTSTTNPQKLLLLAKKNVVVNPTKIVGRPDSQSAVTTANITGSTGDVTVTDASKFQVGDIVQEVGQSTSQTEEINTTGLVTSISGNTLNIDVLQHNASAAAAAVLRHYRDTDPRAAFTIVDGSGTANFAVQRRLYLAAASKNGYALDFAHGGELKNAFTVSHKAGTLPEPGTYTAYVGNKTVFNPTPIASGSTVVHTAAMLTPDLKRVTGEFSFPSSGFNIFKDGFADQATAQAYTLTQLKSDMDGTTHADSTNSWNYDTTIATGYDNAPFFYLAGLGNRHNWNYSALATATTEWRPDVKTTPAEIPVATSMKLLINNVDDYFKDLRGNNAMYFGFDPTFLGSTSTLLGAPVNEDILTVDKYFYSSPGAEQFTLDTRLPATALTTGDIPVVIRPPSGLVGFTTTSPLPPYWLASLKLEDVNYDGTNLKVDPIDIQIHAFVYAQEGSWAVIPTPIPALDPKLKGDGTKSYYNTNGDADADPGEYLDLDNSNSYTAGDQADLNRDGVLEVEEKYWLQRYFRSNYKIDFTGAITENYSLPVMQEGTTLGAVQQWTDALTPTTINTANATPVDVGRITYNFDSDVVKGLMDPNVGTPPVGFYLPETPDLLYQG